MRCELFVHVHSSVEPWRGRQSIRISSKPPLAICHIDVPRPWNVSGHPRRALTGGGSSSASTFGTRASSAPPRTTSKRMIACVVASPPALWRITFEPTPNARKSITTSARSAGSSGIVARRTGLVSRPPSLPICVIARLLPSAA